LSVTSSAQGYEEKVYNIRTNNEHISSSSYNNALCVLGTH